MTKIFSLADEARVQGAVGAIQDAQYISSIFLSQGPCPLTEEEIEDTITLLSCAIVLLKRVEL